MTRRIALLANPVAGRGQAHPLAEMVAGQLRGGDASVRILLSSDAVGTVTRIRQVIAEGADTVIALGSDDMIHVAIQALAGTATALGVVPVGNGNDFARALGLPADPRAATARVLTGSRRPIDLGRAGERWFATILTAGFDALVAARGNTLPAAWGGLRYAAAVTVELPRLTPIRYILDIDGAEHTVEAMVLSVANTEFFGGGVRIAPGAQPDDGLLDLVYLDPSSRLELARFFPVIRTGRQAGHPAYHRVRARRISVAAGGITAYADGERFGDLPLTVECVPGALTVIV